MLIAMAVWDTVGNKRTEQTRETLVSLATKVDWTRHRLIISDNGSCDETQKVYNKARDWMPFYLIQNGENLGTARAVNRAWSYRNPGENVVKMDNDVVVHQTGWADDMEEAFCRDQTIGICGLKRKDLEERPNHPVKHYRSDLGMLPHQPGQKWMVVEDVNHVIGTCQAYSSALFEKIGYLYQGDWRYGFDDALASLRARIAGFRTVFLPYIDIDHIDPGATDYTQQKMKEAGEKLQRYSEIVLEYRMGKRPIFYDGEEDAKWAGTHPLGNQQ